jgi:DNA polymerase III subunit epsilon
VYGIFTYEDQNGYLRLAIEKNKKQLKPAYTFHYLVDGHAILRKIIREFNLCPKLCFMQTGNEKCEGIKEKYCYGACELKEEPANYNNRVQQAIISLQTQPSFAIIEKGLNADDRSCILVWKGKFFGMGYVPADIQITDMETLKDYLTAYKENTVIRNLINGYATRFPSKVLQFENVSEEIEPV